MTVGASSSSSSAAAAAAAAPTTTNEVDIILRDLKSHPGFASYMIMNNDGIVIKYENTDYKRAVQVAHLVLDLLGKSKRSMRDILASSENDVESLRLKTRDYEMIVGQSGNFTIIAFQQQFPGGLLMQQPQQPQQPQTSSNSQKNLK